MKKFNATCQSVNVTSLLKGQLGEANLSVRNAGTQEMTHNIYISGFTG